MECVDGTGGKDPALPAREPIPPDKDVRPLSGPFAMDEDLSILADIERTVKENIKAKRNRVQYVLMGVLFVALLIALLMFFYLIVFMQKISEIYLLRGILTIALSLMFLPVLMLELASERPDIMRPLFDKYMDAGSISPALKKELLSRNEPEGIIGNSRDDAFILSPMTRESFVMKNFKSLQSGTLSAYVMIAPGIICALALLSMGRWIYFITGIAVCVPSAFSAFFIVLDFKYNFASRLSPQNWHALRNTFKWAIPVVAFVAVAFFVKASLAAGTLEGAMGILDGNIFMRIVFALPSAMADLILLNRITVLSAVLPAILWAFGYISYRRMQGTQIIPGRVRLYFLGKYHPEAAGLFQWTGAFKTTDAEGKKQTVHLRSESVEWSRIDMGPGPDAILSKARLNETNVPAKALLAANVVFVAAQILIAGIFMDTDQEFAVGILFNIGLILLLAWFVAILGKGEREKPDIIRMFPIDGGDLSRIITGRMLKYALGPYLGLTTLLCVAMPIRDPAMLIIVLVAVPAFTLAMTYLVALVSFGGSLRGGFFCIAFLIGMILWCINLMLAGIASGIPAWILVCIGLAVLVFFVHHNRRILQDDFHKKYLKRPGWKKRNAKMSVAICLLLLVTAAVPATLTFSGTVRTRFAPEKVAWDVWGESSMVNAIREFDGSVIVHKGGMLEIRDCRVRFNVAALGETRFYIQWGGSLKVINSTISADKYFEFYIGGRAEIQDSTIRRTYGTGSESGIRIGSDNVTIKRTTVERGMHNGITIRYSQALIEDCTIQHNPGAGLETVSSKSIISNNTIRNNGRGVMMDESTDAFQDNTVQNNSGDGLLMVDSSPFLGNNSFIDNRGYAIALAGQSYPIFSDNLFQNNRYGALGNRTFEDSNRWTLVFIAVSMFVPMISLMVVSETRKGLLKKIEKGR